MGQARVSELQLGLRDRAVTLAQARADLAELEAEAEADALDARLDADLHAVERRTIRAPIGGTIADVGELVAAVWDALVSSSPRRHS